MSKSFLTRQPALCDYSIRISRRAKYMRLTVSLKDGLVVVIPNSMTKAQIARLVPEFIKEKEHWIRSAMSKLQAQKPAMATIEDCQLPDCIELKALEQRFFVHYRHQPENSLKLVQAEPFCLTVSGNLSKKVVVFTLLQDFFKAHARIHLKIRLDEISQQFSLPYNRLTIRAQKTRWGSCSAKKNINLNYRLLFIEKPLLDYILLHELVHTQHMNHSGKFWSTLEALMPDARLRDKQVNKVGKSLPCWIYCR